MIKEHVRLSAVWLVNGVLLQPECNLYKEQSSSDNVMNIKNRLKSVPGLYWFRAWFMTAIWLFETDTRARVRWKKISFSIGVALTISMKDMQYLRKYVIKWSMKPTHTLIINSSTQTRYINILQCRITVVQRWWTWSCGSQSLLPMNGLPWVTYTW